jgi:hypothetical protein
VIEFQHDELAVPADRLHRLVEHAPAERGESLANHVMGKKPGLDNAPPSESGRQRSNHGLDFG